MQIPKETVRFRMIGGLIHCLDAKGAILAKLGPDSVNFQSHSTFHAIQCSCGTHMLTISTQRDFDKDDMDMAFVTIWDNPGRSPTPWIHRLKLAWRALRGGWGEGTEVCLPMEHLLALQLAVDMTVQHVQGVIAARDRKK